MELIKNDLSVKMPYTDRYIQLINEGKIVVNFLMILILKRIVRYKGVKGYSKKNKKGYSYHFNSKRTNYLIHFADNNFSMSKGENKKLKLALVQKVWLENIFGWDIEYNKEVVDNEMRKRYVHKIHRLINELAIIMARGSAKTTFAMIVALLNIIVVGWEDNVYGNDVYLIGNTKKQGDIGKNLSEDLISLPNTIPYMLRHNKNSGEPILKATVEKISNQLTKSSIQTLAPVYENLDGLNGSISVFDEIHSYTDERLIPVVKKGASNKRDNWLALYISTNGTVRDSVFDKKYKEWTEILKNDTNDNVLPFLYSIDDNDDFKDENVWQKAMPLLGITPTKEAVRKDLESAKYSTADMSEFLSKSMNIFTNPVLKFFGKESYGNTELFNENLFDYEKGQYATNRAIMGIDASKTNDFYAVSFMILDVKTRIFNFKTLTFIPEISINGQNSPYNMQERRLFNHFIEKGELNAHEYPENTTDYIYEQIINYVEQNNINIVGIGYDMYQADTLVQKLNDYKIYKQNMDMIAHGYYNDSSLISKIPQAGSEMSTNFNSYKTLLVNKKIAYNNELVAWSHDNVNTKNKNGYDKPTKDSNNKKIDPFAAQLDAYSEYKKHQIYYDREVFVNYD